MLRDPLRHYLKEVETAILGLRGVYVERYQEKILTAERVNLWIRIRFSPGFLFQVASLGNCKGATAATREFASSRIEDHGEDA
jgi:hypothetical protein